MDHRPAVRGQGQRRDHDHAAAQHGGRRLRRRDHGLEPGVGRGVVDHARRAGAAGLDRSGEPLAADVRRPSARRDDGVRPLHQAASSRRLEQQPHADQRQRHPARSAGETASLTIGRKLVVYRSDAPDRGYLTAVAAVTGDTLRLRDGISDRRRLHAREPADRRQRRRWRATASVRPRRCSARATPRCRASASCSHSGGLVRPGSEAAARRARRYRRRGRRPDLGAGRNAARCRPRRTRSTP